MKKIFLAIVFILCFSILLGFSLGYIPTLNVMAQDEECPPEGQGSNGRELSEEEKKANLSKNRSARKPNKVPKLIGIEEMLNGRTIVKDKAFWKEGTYVEINDAYLMTHDEQGPETCNCHKGVKRKDNPHGDVHINLSRRENWKNRNNDFYMVVEITPSYKALHPGYHDVLSQLAGEKVTVRGYLFYDQEHWFNSLNYCKQCTGTVIWRKTCWEIHPITYIGPEE